VTDPHSKQFLTDERERWWSEEQIRSIASRLDLSAVRSAVDVGCGQGHWTRIVATVLPANVTLVGVDREQAWINIARERGGHYQVGTAERLPFPDASLDLVTAQTVLIHVRDPALVLGEMARVLKPGGRLWLVEPNNLVATVAGFADPQTPTSQIVAAFELEVICERGKHALGLGYNSIGERLVGLLDARWRDLEIRLCDRVSYPIDGDPPADIVTWPREETLRYFLAGGGDAAAFDALWEASLALVRSRPRGVAGGVLLYSYTARKA